MAADVFLSDLQNLVPPPQPPTLAQDQKVSSSWDKVAGVYNWHSSLLSDHFP